VATELKGVILMTMPKISGPSTRATASVKTKQSVGSFPEGGKKTADDVLASLREMMPGWTISTSTADWGDGFRNIQIDPEILRRMAEDPKEMEKYKNLILDFENMVSDLEKWSAENPGQSIIFEISLSSDGDATSMSIVKKLLGTETRTVFDLPEDRMSWADIIRQRVDALLQGQVEDEYGAKSWVT